MTQYSSRHFIMIWDLSLFVFNISNKTAELMCSSSYVHYIYFYSYVYRYKLIYCFKTINKVILIINIVLHELKLHKKVSVKVSEHFRATGLQSKPLLSN